MTLRSHRKLRITQWSTRLTRLSVLVFFVGFVFPNANTVAQEPNGTGPERFRKPIRVKPVASGKPIAEPLLPRFKPPVVKPAPPKPQQHSSSVLPGGHKPAQASNPGHYTMPIRNLSQLPHGRRVTGSPRKTARVQDPFLPTRAGGQESVPPAEPDAYEKQDEQNQSADEILRRLDRDPQATTPADEAAEVDFLGNSTLESRSISDIQPFIGYALEYVDPKKLPKRLAKSSTDPYVKPERTPIAFHWAASNLHHQPLYFEDPSLERYGHTYHPLVQPFVSAGRMTTQLIGLPYQMAIDPPSRRVYTLGWIRPGDCAPKKIYQVPLNKKAALVEAAAIAGGFYIIP